MISTGRRKTHRERVLERMFGGETNEENETKAKERGADVGRRAVLDLGEVRLRWKRLTFSEKLALWG